MTVTWPEDVIPIEIFSLIVSYLPRSSLENMRLVNKEFEEKVAHDLFQNVVVPFGPEIYDISEESSSDDESVNNFDQAGAQREAAVMLQDKRMRIFQSFGRHINRFGMSFEFDYNLFTMPPMKSDQEAVTTFWGIYRWPLKKYNRYHELEGLEQVADQARTMAQALHFVTNAKELGLSIDGGLGWLHGADTNRRAQLGNEKARVFGQSKSRHEKKPPLSHSPKKHIGIQDSVIRGGLSVIIDIANQLGLNMEVPPLVQMLREAGYEGDNLVHSALTLIESRGPLHHLLNSLDNPVYTSRINCSYYLNPNNLTAAQREILLETEWAQRAFMQSYTLAIIDNATTFHGIETLSIARLPSGHLNILCRSDFWDSLSQLRKVSLAINPDWREVVKLPTSWVEDIAVQPSRAITGVYQLLKDHIAHRKSIKTFHFEWLCGGEEATGLFARNQLILAAPLVPQATDMVHKSNDIQVSVLELPYVEHLTLKNCWISPHIMVRFVKNATDDALTTLTLLSVSLTAPSIKNMQPGPTHLPNNIVLQSNPNIQGQAVTQLMHVQHPQAITAQGIALVQPNSILQYLQSILMPADPSHSMGSTAALSFQLRFGSWADVINQISPSRQPSNLKRIIFDSCGYVRLMHDFDQTVLDSPIPLAKEPRIITIRRKVLTKHMMKPQDTTLGTIINYMCEDERKSLMYIWDLKLDWSAASINLIRESLMDGITSPGHGRFSGEIDGLLLTTT